MGYKQFNINPEKNKEFKLTEKTVMILKKCIELSGEDVRNDYDLFKITTYIEKLIPHSTDMEVLNLGTTFQVMDSIEYLKSNQLV
jgi:hypothetical protein